MKTFLAQNKNQQILKNSSSGGIFYLLASYIISQKGVVFGATWTKDWLVDMKYVDKLEDLPQLMGSKYIQANPKNTFKECQEFLEAGKPVLYAGLPCQLHGLKAFLKKDYNNLYLIDIACHGLLPLNIWKDYLKTLQRPNTKIISINFRLKEPDWINYAFEVKYSDGKILKERHGKNKYMKAFLSDKYLKASCYDCKFKNKFSISDLNIGDAWNIKSTEFDTTLGLSFIKVFTNKGQQLLNKLTSIKLVPIEYEQASLNGCLKNKIEIKPEPYNKEIFNKKVGIVTLHLHGNIGGILQAFALQAYLTKLGFNSEVITWKDSKLLPFATKNIKLRMLEKAEDYNKIKETDYDIIIAGSDQIWRKRYAWYSFYHSYIYNAFLGFTNNWKITRISYAASLGVSGQDWEYEDRECQKIAEILKYFNGVSVRELQSVAECKNKFKLQNITSAVDPTLLLTKKDYLKLCSEIPENKIDVFGYFLDRTEEIDANVKQFCINNNFKYDISEKQTIEEWLASFRDSKYILTDSFHGCVFATIFNKSFICLYNKKRGGARFESLLKLLDTKDNIIYNISELQDKDFKLYQFTNLLEHIEASKQFLETKLYEPAIYMNADKELIKPWKPKPKQNTKQKPKQVPKKDLPKKATTNVWKLL